MADKEATLLFKIKQVGGEILDKFVFTLGDVIDIAKKVAEALYDTFEAFAENEAAVKKLNQAMINQGVYSSELQNKYLEQANALQKVTTFSDDQIISATTLLQTQIGAKKVTEELLVATLNLAEGTGKDLNTAALIVGKSISGEVDILKKAGIETANVITSTDKMAAVISAIEGKFHGYAEGARAGTGATKGLGLAFEDVQKAIGERVAPVVILVSKYFADLFTKIAEWTGQNTLASNSAQGLSDKIVDLKIEIEKYKKSAQGTGSAIDYILGTDVVGTELAILEEKLAIALEAQKKYLQDVQAAAINQKTVNADQAAQDRDAALQLAITQQDADMQMIGANEAQKTAATISWLQKRHDAAATAGQKLAISQEIFRQKERQAQQMQHDLEVKNRGDTLAKIATLQDSGNSTMAAIGKAAGIAQIAIATPVAIAQAIASGIPFPGNMIAAGLVAVAMAAQAAKLAGVPLAQGGIVRATSGGVPAIIGEGGRDEAVIPLDKNGNMPGGGGVNITVYGGLLGDQSSAREFAIAVDKALLELRRNNESVSFDQVV